MLTIALCTFAYIGIGYTLGKLANKLFHDERPTEVLGFRSRILRLIFFPIYCQDWKRRTHRSSSPYDHDLSLRFLVGADWKDRDHSRPIDKDALERYAIWHAILWPLKVLNAFPLALMVVLAVLCETGSLWERGFLSLSRLFRRPTGSANLSQELSVIKSFMGTELVRKMTVLGQQSAETSRRVEQIQGQIKRWESLRERFDSAHLSIDRFRSTLQDLGTLLADTEQSAETVSSAWKQLKAKHGELALLVEMLEEYERTAVLLSQIKSDAGMKDQVESTLKTARALIDVCKKIYALEDARLVHQDDPDVMPLVAQRLEADEMKNQIRQIAMN